MVPRPTYWALIDIAAPVGSNLFVMSKLPGLTRATAPHDALIVKGERPQTGIVHLGLGNFHRAHFAVYTAKAVAAAGGDWGIFAYSFRSKTLAEALTAQELLYSVIEFAPNTDAVAIPAIHTGAVAGPDMADRVVEEIAKSSTKIISMTVTEGGYSISQKTNGLNLESADIQSDLAGNSPKTLIGLIVRGLQGRVRSHGSPITVLSCDNLSSNGDKTKQLVSEFINALPVEESAPLAAYLATSVTFPNSMVDRIVPGTEERHIELAEQRLGVHDSSPVPAEPFTMWALEDNFIAGRPAWELAGATFTDQIDRFEIMKIRLLNGAHSLLAYFGALENCETIPDCRFQPFIEESLRTGFFAEMLPTLRMPDGLTSNEYIAQLFSRWSNTVLGDKTSRVGSDGSIKLPQRITEPVLMRVKQGERVDYIALTVAAWLACVAPINGFDPGPIAKAMKDPALARLKEFAATSSTASELLDKVFHEGNIFAPELAALPGFTAQIAQYLDLILKRGIRESVATLQN